MLCLTCCLNIERIIDLNHSWLQRLPCDFRRFQKASEGRCRHLWMKILKLPIWQLIVHASLFNDAWCADAKTKLLKQKHAFRRSHFLNAYSSETKAKGYLPLTTNISVTPRISLSIRLAQKEPRLFRDPSCFAFHQRLVCWNYNRIRHSTHRISSIHAVPPIWYTAFCSLSRPYIRFLWDMPCQSNWAQGLFFCSLAMELYANPL